MDLNDTEKPTIAAVFDLDGTLYTGHIVRGVTHHHRTHRVKRLPLTFYMTTHMAMWPLWKLGLLPDLKVRELWIRHLGWTVRGWTHQEAATAFAWIAEQYVRPLVRPDVMKRVWDHQVAGHRVILVSGTPAHLPEHAEARRIDKMAPEAARPETLGMAAGGSVHLVAGSRGCIRAKW